MSKQELQQHGIVFRPETGDDREFLRILYASTREAEMAMVPWTKEQIEEFLDMQFDAQSKFYAEQFKDAEFSIVTQGGRNIGRLYVDRRPNEIRIIDIALLPKHRGRGYGDAILRHVMQIAARDGLPVTIHVEKNNPAMRLYKKLGYTLLEDQGVYDLMQWTHTSP
ncbi:N-acetyltransferase GCN5 [Arenicella chitinivorans]|uniref:N-acetyltransferase GCN5 n=1 Tax=Arenicella chitinivorans TaxID=1329800 RepID=A0A918RW06_9GAMM|nr:GNAT family N-acetyltransferase [Arenicella chitinivorans]GHA13528.1 N-acetyltransferase GCN5 [Arenicella chitinivorans]